MKKILFLYLLIASSSFGFELNSDTIRIKVIEIDSAQFYSMKEETGSIIPEKLNKISDFQTAKELLRGIVTFTNDSEQNVDEIYFKNGKKFKNQDDCYFVAYYPNEEILICEGGHATDVSFNLKNGKETEEVGNPEYFRTSPNKKFRLNAHFGGQECYSYFLQEKIKGEYQKIIQLDEELEKQTKLWLCTIGESFWSDDSTLFLTEYEYTDSGRKSRYFRVELIID